MYFLIFKITITFRFKTEKSTGDTIWSYYCQGDSKQIPRYFLYFAYYLCDSNAFWNFWDYYHFSLQEKSDVFDNFVEVFLEYSNE